MSHRYQKVSTDFRYGSAPPAIQTPIRTRTCARRRPVLLGLAGACLVSLVLCTTYLLTGDDALASLLGTQEDIPILFECPNVSSSDLHANLSPSQSSRTQSFIYPPRRSTLDRSPANAYSLFRPSADTLVYPKDTRLRPVRAPPAHCLDSFVSFGEACGSSGEEEVRFDLVWTWVNGSDQLQRDTLQAAPNVGTATKGRILANSKLYRDHDELKHSMRSVLNHFRPHAHRFHILTADYPLPSCSPSRIGQVPQWLDLDRPDAWRDGDVELAVSHHSQIGIPAPVFNSFAIEALLANVPHVSDNFLYMNDDYFFTSDMTVSDFYTPHYGLVFRMQPDLLVTSKEKSNSAPSGEWNSLEWSNWLLDNRFGARKRPYVIHIAKSVSLPLLEEMSAIWSAELHNSTASHAFRGAGKDAYAMYMMVHFVVERHREALLWSWVVGRISGREDDRWGEEEMERAWAELGGDEEAEEYGVLSIERRARSTLLRDRVASHLTLAGFSPPKKTTYGFSSADGYPYTEAKPRSSFPSFAEGEKNKDLGAGKCAIDFALCLGTDGEPATRASEVFRRVAFERPTCGDCIIMALVSDSGPLGLSAFLPPTTDADLAYPLSPSPTAVPHLPLTDSYLAADFSLSSVLASTSPSLPARTFALSLLSRYAYVIGDTPVKFLSVRSAVSGRSSLALIDRDSNTALLCVNDDIVGKEAEADKVMREWEGKRWPKRAGWERGSAGWF